MPSPNSVHDDDFPLIDAKIIEDELPFPLSPSHLEPTSYVQERKTRRPGRKHLCDTLRSTPGSTHDRFVPLRASIESAPANFRTSKSPYQLSTTERLLRTRPSTWDPFAPRRITSIPQPRNSIPSMSFRNPWTVRAGGPSDRHRAASAGAVWNVGGAAPQPTGPLSAVDNGRGGVFGSGTNAPIFFSNFFRPETADQSHERFEGRLASALDIDQANRMFDYSYPPVSRRKPSLASIPRGPSSPHTVWQDGMWTSSRGECTIESPCSNKEKLIGELAAPRVIKHKQRTIPATPFRYVNTYTTTACTDCSIQFLTLHLFEMTSTVQFLHTATTRKSWRLDSTTEYTSGLREPASSTAKGWMMTCGMCT